MLVMRRRTKSLGLYIQMVGRLLRTIGGHIDMSILRGKADGLVVDFAGNIDQHGPLDFLRPKETKASLVSCDACGNRNPVAARNCWSCDEPMMKLCPACLEPVQKGTLDCLHCQHDMRVAGGEPRKAAALLETPSGAALISAFAKNHDREGGWVAIRKAYRHEDGRISVDTDEQRIDLPEYLVKFGEKAKWIRTDDLALLIPNGASRTSVLQVKADGTALVVPMPPVLMEDAA